MIFMALVANCIEYFRVYYCFIGKNIECILLGLLWKVGLFFTVSTVCKVTQMTLSEFKYLLYAYEFV